MRKCQCLFHVLKRSYICYYIICMSVISMLRTLLSHRKWKNNSKIINRIQQDVLFLIRNQHFGRTLNTCFLLNFKIVAYLYQIGVRKSHWLWVYVTLNQVAIEKGITCRNLIQVLNILFKWLSEVIYNNTVTNDKKDRKVMLKVFYLLIY